MKPIEIRAWDKIENTMWYDVLGDFADNDQYDDEDSMWSVARMMTTGDDSRFIFMLFSNKVDKNDKKIFEHDSISLSNHPNKTFETLFENGSWVLKNNEGPVLNLFDFNSEDIEVLEKEFNF